MLSDNQSGEADLSLFGLKVNLFESTYAQSESSCKCKVTDIGCEAECSGSGSCYRSGSCCYCDRTSACC